MKKLITFFSVIVIATACNNESKSVDKTDSTTATISPLEEKKDTLSMDHHTAANALDWAGTYKGILPCADCEGIETEIMLHKDSTYMLSAIYLGKKDKTTHKQQGNWKWIDGSTIELDGIKSGPSKYFVAEGSLLQLDLQGQKIEGVLAEKYRLKKV